VRKTPCSRGCGVFLSASTIASDHSRAGLARESRQSGVSRDPDDNVVLATALAAQAFLMISGDLDLLDLGTFRDIHILNAADALRALGA
jgi:predicted nucleic acid-binding protein